MSSARDTWDAFKEVFREFSDDKVMQLAAALSYYTILSVAPLLVLLIGVAGLVISRQSASEQLVAQIQAQAGDQGAAVARTVIQHAAQPRGSIISIVVGAIVLLVGATGVFVQLQDSLNQIWNVEPKPLGVWGFVRSRLLSLLMLTGIGLLLLASVVASAVLTGITTYMSQRLPIAAPLWNVANIVLSLIIVTLLFAMIFKVLPDVEIRWESIWVGAIVTGVLFTIGKTLIGLYLGHSAIGSVYGAAGSLVVFLVWIYYSALIVFLGAEFTQVFARRYGQRIEPDRDAIRRDRGEEGGGRLAGAH